MNKEQIIQILQQSYEPLKGDETLTELQTKLKCAQRTRHLLFWHDHATILSKGYLLVTVSTLYDPLVYLTEEEYANKIGKPVDNLQEIIEQPHIHLLTLGGSSVSDQIATIADRTDCLLELETKVVTSQGIEVSDIARFFFVATSQLKTLREARRLEATTNVDLVVSSQA